MPDKEEKLSNEPMVDLDTSGPGAKVELPEAFSLVPFCLNAPFIILLSIHKYLFYH